MYAGTRGKVGTATNYGKEHGGGLDSRMMSGPVLRPHVALDIHSMSYCLYSTVGGLIWRSCVPSSRRFSASIGREFLPMSCCIRTRVLQKSHMQQ